MTEYKSMMKKLSIVVLLISCSSAQAITDCATQTDIPESECTTLLSLFSSTSGGIWFDVFINGWDVTQTPCTWTGITCNEGHVTEINRANIGLDGTLPNLSNLTQLKVLDVSDNELTGSIDYQQLPPSLETLNFQGTELTEIIVEPPPIDETATPSTISETIPTEIVHESTPIIPDLPPTAIPDTSTTVSSVSSINTTQINSVEEDEGNDINDISNSETTDLEIDVTNNTEFESQENNQSEITNLTQTDSESDVTNEIEEELPLLGFEGEGQEVDKSKGKLFTSNSYFRGGIRKEGESIFSKQVTFIGNQLVSIKGKIHVNPEHIGERADLLALGIYDIGNQKLFYTNTPEGVKVIEIGRFGIPIFNDDKLLKKDILLEESMEFMLYEGQLFVGQLNVYFGYRVESQPDSIFYTMNPIRAVVQ